MAYLRGFGLVIFLILLSFFLRIKLILLFVLLARGLFCFIMAVFSVFVIVLVLLLVKAEEGLSNMLVASKSFF